MSSYTTTTVSGKGDLQFYWTAQEIYVENTIDDLTAQELLDAIREVEDSPLGILNGKIADASGKTSLDASVQTSITLVLLEGWKVYSQKSSGFFSLKDGNIVRHDATTPFKANTNITYQQLLVQGGVITTVNSGSGLSTDEHNQLMSLNTGAETATEVWSAGTSASYPANSFATKVFNLLTKGQFISGS